MEFANAGVAVYRQAKSGDEGALRHLLERAHYGNRYVDWHEPSDWKDDPTFLVAELKSSADGQLLSCLKVTEEVPPAAWVRLAAVRDRKTARRQMIELFQGITPHLLGLGVERVGWLAATGWPEELLKDLGFELANWITSYHSGIKPGNYDDYKNVSIRPAGFGDIATLARIEFKAFEPIWRLSRLSLENAFKQALSYDVALKEGKVTGFQFSVRGYNQRSAHLVRITVDPEFQGEGVGSALLARAMNSYLEQGIVFVSLNTQINNLASHRLYDRFGFTAVGDQIPLYIKRIHPEEKKWNERNYQTQKLRPR